MAERKALDHALSLPHFTTTPSFFIEWKKPRHAPEAGLSGYRDFDMREAFAGRLQARHGRKTGFWSRVMERRGAFNRR